jgi:peroxin-1
LDAAVVTVNAQELSEDRLSVVTEKLSAAFVQAAWKSPSIIVIDDMERLFPAEVEVG